MEGVTTTIDTAIRNNDYTSIASVFSYGPSSWQSVGQGEQRSLAAHFIKSAVNTPGFLPQAFSSGQMMNVMLETLGHLPSTVEGAADNQLRKLLFDYKVNEESDYTGAARVLAGMRMEDDPNSVYYTTPAEKCDGTYQRLLLSSSSLECKCSFGLTSVSYRFLPNLLCIVVYVKIAECFLEEDEIVESDSAVTKAGSVVESIQNPEQHMALILRYKSTYARVLDANRKFLQAASRYHDLSQSSSDLIRAEDLLGMLGRAATCAILAPSGPQRQRILGHVSRIYPSRRLFGLERWRNLLTN